MNSNEQRAMNKERPVFANAQTLTLGTQACEPRSLLIAHCSLHLSEAQA